MPMTQATSIHINILKLAIALKTKIKFGIPRKVCANTLAFFSLSLVVSSAFFSLLGILFMGTFCPGGLPKYRNGIWVATKIENGKNWEKKSGLFYNRDLCKKKKNAKCKNRRLFNSMYDMRYLMNQTLHINEPWHFRYHNLPQKINYTHCLLK